MTLQCEHFYLMAHPDVMSQAVEKKSLGTIAQTQQEASLFNLK